MIYDANLVAKWIRENSVSIEIAEMFALNFVKEKAKELGKENLWTDLWRYDGAAVTNEISDRRHFGRGFADRSRCNCPYLRNNDDDTRPPPGPLKIPVKVGYRFWPFWALTGGPKLTQIGGLMGGFGTRHPKKSLDGWTSVSNL